MSATTLHFTCKSLKIEIKSKANDLTLAADEVPFILTTADEAATGQKPEHHKDIGCSYNLRNRSFSIQMNL